MTSAKKPTPKHTGISIAATFSLWGALLFFAPGYIGFDGLLRTIFVVAGYLVLIFSVVILLNELRKLRDAEVYNYLSVTVFFGGLAIPLHFMELPDPWEAIARGTVLVLLAVAGPAFLMGIPYLFWRAPDRAMGRMASGDQLPSVPVIPAKGTGLSDTRDFISLGAALLSLAAVLLKIAIGELP